jgi:hypothetical protein
MVGRARGALMATLVTLGAVSGVTAATPPEAMAATAATAVSASFAANPISFDATGTVRGTLVRRTNARGLGGQTVALFDRAVGGVQWHDTARRARTASNGAYEIRVPNRTSTREYQVRFGGSASYAATRSAAKTLRVRAPLSALVMEPGGATAIQGTTRTWRGATHRSLAGSTADAQLRRNGVWETLWTATIRADGTFAIPMQMSELGTHQYRVFVSESLRLAAVASSARSITVGRLAVNTSSLPGGTVGTAYTATLRSSFADPPVSWTSTGALPDGLTLSTSGVLSGVPTKAGSFSVDFVVTDALDHTASRRLILTVAESPAPIIIDSKLPAGQIGVGYAYSIRTVSGRAPFTWSLSSGALPVGLALDATTGLVSGTPTAPDTTSVTVRVADADGDTSSRSLPISIGVASTWQQDRGDESQRSYVPTERSIDAATIGAVRREWTIPGGCCKAPSAIAGGTIYTGGPLPDSERNGITARDLRTGDVLWSAQIADGVGGTRSCTSVAVTSASVICSTGINLAAVSRSSTHAVQWSTLETDPGVGLNAQMLVVESAGLVIATTGNNGHVVVAYRLSDGQRLWQRNADHHIYSLAAGDGRLYVATRLGDGSDVGSLETFALSATGAPGWSTTTGSGDVVAIDGAVLSVEYTGGAHVVWRDANTGSVLRRYRPSGPLYGHIAADASNAYVPTAGFFAPDEWWDAGIEAVRLSDATRAWAVPTGYPIRAGIAVGGPIVWVHASDLLRYRIPSELYAVQASDGEILRRISPGDTSGYAPVVGGGRVLVHNSRGGEIYGTAPPVPAVATRRLPTGWRASAYSATLAASAGTPPFRWAHAGGGLPPGLTLGADGAISGNPTTPGSFVFTVAVTDAAGVTATRELAIAVRDAATASWPTAGGAGGRAALAGAEASIDSDTIATFGPRWTSPWSTVFDQIGIRGEEVVTSGSRAFLVDGSSAVRAVDVSSPPNSAPLWTRALPNGEFAVGTPALSGSPLSGTVYVVGYLGRLHALDAATGAISWSVQLADDYLYRESSVLIAGDLVLVHTGAHITAVNASTHAIAWTHPFAQSRRGWMAGLAADGTRVFAIDGCHAVALTVSTGEPLWDQPIGPPDAQCFMLPPDSRFPVVVADTVYTWTYDGLTAFDTATGAVRWRTSNNAGGTPVGIAATENWIVLTHRSGPLWVHDRRTGALLGRTTDELAAYSAPAIAGDLALLWNSSGRLVAVDLLTLEEVWSSAVVGGSGNNSRPAINAGRVYVYASDTGFTQTRLVALGPP